MADPKLKLELLCPRCQTPNQPHAVRCRQCFNDLSGLRPAERTVGVERLRPSLPTCQSCGCSNVLSLDRCVECGDAMHARVAASTPPMPSMTLPLPEPEAEPMVQELEEAPMSTRRRKPRRRAFSLPSLARVILVTRLAAVFFLLWSAYDISAWLERVAGGLAPGDNAALRYNMYALYELGRNTAIVLGIWLLTSLGQPRR